MTSTWTDEMQFSGETLILAVAQKSFEAGGNNFSTLRPLATLEGLPIEPSEFPNRGLVWWMLRGSPDLLKSHPGRLLIARVAPSSNPDKTDPERDLYQVEYETVEIAGPRKLIEIITLDDQRNGDPNWIINGASVILEHEPTPLVLVRLNDRVYGPFRCHVSEDASGHSFEISFQKTHGDRPIHSIEASGLRSTHRFAEVALDSQSPLRTAFPVRCSYEIVLWNDFESAGVHAGSVRLATDEEIVSRVARTVSAVSTYGTN